MVRGKPPFNKLKTLVAAPQMEGPLIQNIQTCISLPGANLLLPTCLYAHFWVPYCHATGCPRLLPWILPWSLCRSITYQLWQMTSHVSNSPWRKQGHDFNKHQIVPDSHLSECCCPDEREGIYSISSEKWAALHFLTFTKLHLGRCCGVFDVFETHTLSLSHGNLFV